MNGQCSLGRAILNQVCFLDIMVIFITPHELVVVPVVNSTTTTSLTFITATAIMMRKKYGSVEKVDAENGCGSNDIDELVVVA